MGASFPLGFAVITLFYFVFCASAEQSYAVQSITEANNRFTEDVYREIVKQRKSDNLIVSPFSLASVLTMVRAGALGRTADELTKGLQLSNTNDSFVYDGYSDLIFQLHENKEVIIETGNKIFAANGFEIKESYLQLLREKFYALAENVDFTTNVETAGKINKYVSTATHGKIENVVNPDMLSERTKIVLINAIYFKGTWKYQFNKEMTQKFPFQTLEGKVIDTDMMTVRSEFEYKEIPQLKSSAISIPYNGGRFSMIIILPDENVKLSDVELQLTDSILATLPSTLKSTDIRLRLPKFKLETDIDFVSTEILQNMGMKDFVTSKANFGGISSNLGLHVNAVVQKAFIEVNEEGTEAAAATSAIFAIKSAGPIITDFTVNRPFIAYIFDEETSSVLFVARKVK